MKNLLLVMMATLLTSGNAIAQDAKVIQLSEQDAKTAKQLYDAKIAANNAYEDFQKKIKLEYTLNKPKYKNEALSLKEGWLGGFIFSQDFKFIVPSPYSTTLKFASSPCWSTYSTSPVTATLPLSDAGTSSVVH